MMGEAEVAMAEARGGSGLGGRLQRPQEHRCTES